MCPGSCMGTMNVFSWPDTLNLPCSLETPLPLNPYHDNLIHSFIHSLSLLCFCIWEELDEHHQYHQWEDSLFLRIPRHENSVITFFAWPHGQCEWIHIRKRSLRLPSVWNRLLIGSRNAPESRRFPLKPCPTMTCLLIFRGETWNKKILLTIHLSASYHKMWPSSLKPF